MKKAINTAARPGHSIMSNSKESASWLSDALPSRMSGNRPPSCALCGAIHPPKAMFCVGCGASLDQRSSPLVPAPFHRARAGIARRALASVIDRMVPLPWLAYFFPAWIVVVIVYALLCDGSPSGRSMGKWVCRLRVISLSSSQPCGFVRSIIRRLGPALCQVAYCTLNLFWVAIAYEMLSLALVLLSSSGRRIEDYAADTQVITESAYKRLQRICSSCGHSFRTSYLYCPHCGASPEQGKK